MVVELVKELFVNDPLSGKRNVLPTEPDAITTIAIIKTKTNLNRRFKL